MGNALTLEVDVLQSDIEDWLGQVNTRQDRNVARGCAISKAINRAVAKAGKEGKALTSLSTVNLERPNATYFVTAKLPAPAITLREQIDAKADKIKRGYGEEKGEPQPLKFSLTFERGKKRPTVD